MALIPRGARRLIGQERLVVLLDLGPTPHTSASARRVSIPVRRRGAKPWHVADRGREEVERVAMVLGVGDDLVPRPQGLLATHPALLLLWHLEEEAGDLGSVVRPVRGLRQRLDSSRRAAWRSSQPPFPSMSRSGVTACG